MIIIHFSFQRLVGLRAKVGRKWVTLSELPASRNRPRRCTTAKNTTTSFRWISLKANRHWSCRTTLLKIHGWPRRNSFTITNLANSTWIQWPILSSPIVNQVNLGWILFEFFLNSSGFLKFPRESYAIFQDSRNVSEFHWKFLFSVNGKAGGDSSSGFCDPLTGGSRYVPAQSNAALNSASSSGDPFTGTGRYVPGQSSVPLNTVPSTGDPFTGSGRYVAGTQPVAAATHSSSYFPVRDFLRFDQANIEAISSNLKKKIKINSHTRISGWF